MADKRQELLAVFAELIQLTILDEASTQSFRVRAYENAIEELRITSANLAELTVGQLTKIDGVGKSTAQKIRQFYDSGTIDKLEKLREKYPPDFVMLSRIHGLGPKTLLRLRAELGVENITQLRAAIATDAVAGLRGLGRKTQDKLASSIERLGMTSKDVRTPIAEALPLADRLVTALSELPDVQRVMFCGSLRRHRTTIGDIDIVVAADESAAIMDAFVKLGPVKEVLGSGKTKTSIITSLGMQVDLRVVKPDEFGAAAMYFTGSKAHNIKLRGLAMKRGWTLNEYGLVDKDTGAVIASKSEDEIYRALGLQPIPPPMREDSGEVERSAANNLVEAMSVEQLRGDLHVHSSLSGDGRSSLRDMLQQACDRGYEYIAITDHAEDLALNGVDRDALRAQWAQMAALSAAFPSMRLLTGCELNIGATGGLDYDPEFRLEMDWCVAAVHSHFDLDQTAQTNRIVTAMSDPAVSAIGHLSGRMIGRRPGIELDVEAVLQAAVETHTAIEINCALPRLDAASPVLRRAHDLGVVFVMSTDAHHVDDMDRMRWGALHAQRGWVAPQRILNTWPRDQFLAWIADGRK